MGEAEGAEFSEVTWGDRLPGDKHFPPLGVGRARGKARHDGEDMGGALSVVHTAQETMAPELLVVYLAGHESGESE